MNHKEEIVTVNSSDDSSERPSLPAKYRILERLGQGGMGVTWKVEDTILRRVCVIKHPLRAYVGDKDVISRFKREGQALAIIEHPNVVRIYEFEARTPNEIPYIVMQYVDGENLRKIIKEGDTKGRLVARRAVEIAIQVCRGLVEAHAKKVIHRDLKPENLLVDNKTKEVIIIDFGIAKLRCDTNSSLGTHPGMGSPQYMAPEQVFGRRVDERTDIYSLGVILYEMLTGEAPQIDYNANDMKHVAGLSALRPELPMALKEAVQKALAYEPSKRFQKAEEFKNALEGVSWKRKSPLYTKTLRIAIIGTGILVAISILWLILRPGSFTTSRDGISADTSRSDSDAPIQPAEGTPVETVPLPAPPQNTNVDGNERSKVAARPEKVSRDQQAKTNGAPKNGRPIGRKNERSGRRTGTRRTVPESSLPTKSSPTESTGLLPSQNGEKRKKLGPIRLNPYNH